jgi:hypothetical protein
VQVCIVYDCLVPYTIGGAERGYRNVASRCGDLADALVTVHHRGPAMRTSTPDWFAGNAACLFLRRWVNVVHEAYGGRG